MYFWEKCEQINYCLCLKGLLLKAVAFGRITVYAQMQRLTVYPLNINTHGCTRLVTDLKNSSVIGYMIIHIALNNRPYKYSCAQMQWIQNACLFYNQSNMQNVQTYYLQFTARCVCFVSQYCLSTPSTGKILVHCLVNVRWPFVLSWWIIDPTFVIPYTKLDLCHTKVTQHFVLFFFLSSEISG